MSHHMTFKCLSNCQLKIAQSFVQARQSLCCSYTHIHVIGVDKDSDNMLEL